MDESGPVRRVMCDGGSGGMTRRESGGDEFLLCLKESREVGRISLEPPIGPNRPCSAHPTEKARGVGDLVLHQ